MHTNLIFYPPPGNFDFPVKTPKFNTTIQLPYSGRNEIRVSGQVYPTWVIDLKLNAAAGSERVNGSLYQYMLGFFLAMGGQLSDFLYQDPYDHIIVDDGSTGAEGPVYFGLGDGISTQFQLTRPIGIGADIVQNLKSAPLVYVNGILADASTFTVSSVGIITFVTAPTSGEVLTWSGDYYYRVRFTDDSLSFEELWQQMWQAQKISLTSIPL